MHSPIPFISRLLWPNRRRASFHTLREGAPQAASKPKSSERMLEVIALAYEIQYQELMRSVAIAQGLVSAVTLSAALASPLLLIGARRSPSNAVFGLLLILYLGTLGNSLRHAFWAFCTKPIFRPAVRTSPTPGFMTYLFISTFESPQKYQEYFRSLSEEARLDHLIDQTFTDANLVKAKFVALSKTIQWSALSFGLLAMLVLFRFAINFFSWN